jgi:hypothetical protein
MTVDEVFKVSKEFRAFKETWASKAFKEFKVP